MEKRYFFLSIVLFFFPLFFLCIFLFPEHAVAADIFPDLLYSPTSPWNEPIGTNVQIDQNSSAMVNAISGGRHVATVFGFGMPIYVSTASDPLYKVNDGDQGSDGAFASKNPFHIPNSAAPAPGFGSDADHWMFVYDTTDNTLHEMWEAKKSGNTWSAQVANAFDPTGDGVLQVDGSHTDGNGASYFGGVVRHADVTRGYINHALSLVTPDTGSAFRYPLWASDGHGSGASALPEGARLQLDPTFDCNSMNGASNGEKMVCKAMETYGGYIQDTGAGGGTNLTIYFEGEDLTDPSRNPPTNPGDGGRSGGIFGNVGITDNGDFSHIPWNRVRVLKAWNSYTPVTITPPSSSSSSSTSQSSSSSTGITPNPTQPVSNGLDVYASLALLLPGIGKQSGNINPIHPIRDVVIYLYTPDQNPTDLSNKPLIITTTVKLDQTPGDATYGYFINKSVDIGKLAGDYQIFVKLNQYLRKQFIPSTTTSSTNAFTLTGGQTIPLPQVTLLPGDIYPPSNKQVCSPTIPPCPTGQRCPQIVTCSPISLAPILYGDNVLDISDYNQLISCFDKKATTNSTCSAADLNDDGTIDGIDYNLMLRSFNQLASGSN